MKHLVAGSFFLCVINTFALAQDWPQPTEAGDKALDALIARCVEAGGLAWTKDAKTGRDVLSIADQAKLSRALANPAITEVATVREALVARTRSTNPPEQSAWISLLRSLGEATGDGRTKSYVDFLEGLNLSRSDPNAAIERYRQALAYFEKNGDQPWMAACLNQMGRTWLPFGGFKDALECFEKALEIGLQALGPKHPGIALSYNGLGLCYRAQGDLTKALEFIQKALAIRLEALGPKHPDVAMSYNNLAACQVGLGDHATALELFQKTLTIRLEALGPKHPDVGMSYNNIALCQGRLGEQARELETLQKALTIRLEALGPKDPDVAASYNNIALCQRDLGEPARALMFHQKALAIQLEVLGAMHPEVAISYSNMALCLRSQGEHARSLEGFQKSMAIWQEVFGPKHPEIGDLYNDIADSQWNLGERARAMESLQKSLSIRQEAFGPKHPDVAQSYSNLAIGHKDLGHPAEALKNYDLALEAIETKESTPRPGVSGSSAWPASSFVIQTLLQRAQLLDRGAGGLVTDRSRVFADLEKAADLLDRMRDSASGNARTLQVDMVNRGEDASDLWPMTIDILARLAEQEHDPGRLEAAVGTAERGASRAFLQSFGRTHAALVGRVSPEVLAELARADSRLYVLDQKIEQAQSVPVENRDPKAVGPLLDERREAEAERGKVIARIERDFPQYAALKYPRPCTLDQARATLGDDEVALHFVAGTDASFLVVLEKMARAYPTGIGIHRLPTDGELAEQVAALVQDKVLMDPDSTRDRGSRLYQTLLGPAAKAIEGRNLVVVAGGSVGELPFEVLSEPDGKGGQRWLVQGHQVRYAPSLTALHFVGLWDKARPPTDRPLWVLADPTYEASDPRLAKDQKPSDDASITLAQASRATRGESMTRLVASGIEVEKITGVHGAAASDRLVGPEATEASVKRLSNTGELAHYRLIHFACHGVLGSSDGLPPGLVLAQGGDQEGEDGYLRLDEVANLKLDADLVVLSACQTARGKRGRVEGVNSLGRAFLYAGCRGVVGSLWKVDDAATADLMAAFYTRLKAGHSTGQALRDTQLEAIASDQPPYFWAPFILLGR